MILPWEKKSRTFCTCFCLNNISVDGILLGLHQSHTLHPYNNYYKNSQVMFLFRWMRAHSKYFCLNRLPLSVFCSEDFLILNLCSWTHFLFFFLSLAYFFLCMFSFAIFFHSLSFAFTFSNFSWLFFNFLYIFSSFL